MNLPVIQKTIIEIEKHFIATSVDFRAALVQRIYDDSEELLTQLEKDLGFKVPEDLYELLGWTFTTSIGALPHLEGDTDSQASFLRAGSIDVYAKMLRNSETKGWWSNTKLIPLMEVFGGKSEKQRLFYYDIEGEFEGVPGSIIYLEFTRDRINDKNHISNVERKSAAPSLQEWLERYFILIQKFLPQTQESDLPEEIVELLQDPESLFDYVDDYNWDDGEEILEKIIKNPQCDQATALMIYWRSSPYNYEEKEQYKGLIIPFIIEENFQKGFYATSNNHYDPHRDGVDYIKNYQEKRKELPRARKLPHFMQIAV